MFIRQINYLSRGFVGLIVLTAIGCGQSDRLAIAGRVTVNGKPVDQGLLVFAPVESKTAAGGAPVGDGEFSLSKAHGLRPGEYKVSLTAMRRTGNKVNDRQANQLVEELVAMKVKSEKLPVTISISNAENLDLNFSAAE